MGSGGGAGGIHEHWRPQSSSRFFLNMGQTWPLFVDFDSFSQDNYKYGTYSTSAIGFL